MLKTIGILLFFFSAGLHAQEIKHPVSSQKSLDDQWMKDLYARRGRTVYTGDQLKTIGMPIGGIAAGQLYIRGDGTLAQWWIANNAYNTGVNPPLQTPLGPMPVNYTSFTPVSFIDQGFSVKIRSVGKVMEKKLNKQDCKRISFTGEYPIARIQYDDLPVKIAMEAFSPFIPLDAKASATPGTYLIFKLRNTTNLKTTVDLTGWLQNPVCLELQNEINGHSRNRVVKGEKMTSLLMDMLPVNEPVPQKEVVFDDFEQVSVPSWTVTGSAFQHQPAQGAIGDQQPVKGFAGKRCINSFNGGDSAMGIMISKEFMITNDYVYLLVGGGMHAGKTEVRLIADGAIQFSATGKNTETLSPVNWNVKKLKGKKAHFEIVDNHTGSWGHILVDRIQFSNAPVTTIRDITSHPYFGNVSLSVLTNKAHAVAGIAVKNDVALTGLGEKLVGSITTTTTLAPGEEKQVVFMLTWYFPNRPLHHAGGWDWGKAVYTSGPAVGNMYANWYGSSLDVAMWLQENRQQLTGLTYRFHKSYYKDANLPYWLRHRIMMPVSTLATETTQWWANNKFWAWEGVGACNGTCTHVWNYEQALAHLFPGLERNIRERTDFATSLQNDGGVMTRDGADGVKIDGHIGTILKTYREHLRSANDLFLSRNWENVKKVTRFAIGQDAQEGKIDGIISNQQQNTYDISFYGANTFVGSLYLAALKAAESMALKMNEPVFADSCRTIFESGSRLSMQQLWNGNYFIQRVDLRQYPHGQYGDGCLSDQLFGQTWAHLLNLGYIYPEDKVKQTLQTVWNNNWTNDVAAYNKLYPPDRIFARNGDAGLINCTWPNSKHPGKQSIPYRDEVWTGVEYQVATNMIYDGMVNEGLSIVKAIHDRYQPEKHNPWNEIECGDHYARAMASWGVLLALEDFHYNGPEGLLAFAPKIQQHDFNGFFTAASGWGNLVQRRFENKQLNEVQVAFGELQLATLQVQIDKAVYPKKITVQMNDRGIPCTWKQAGKKCTIDLVDGACIRSGQKLVITVNF